MLHRIRPPACADHLACIMQFQRHVLAFACSLGTFEHLYEGDIRTEFGEEVGKWFWGKLQKRNGAPSELHATLVSLIAFVQANPAAGASILAAFDHDTSFQGHLSDPDFRFHYTTVLDEQSRNAVRPLMQAFYEDLLASGFPSCITGKTGLLDRDGFVASFWAANSKLEVCPACDGARPERIDIKVYADADHFLPKSKYPFLAVHPANLVPVCLACNRSFKTGRDPIDNPNDQPLVNTFHPYGRPAIDHVDVKVDRDDVGVRHVHLEDQGGMPSRRVVGLNRAYRLEERWPDSLKYEIKSLCEILAEQGHLLQAYGYQVGADDLRMILTSQLQKHKDKVGQQHHCLLDVGYLDLALDDAGEFDDLLRQFLAE